jgi:hypothetical protein
MHDEPIGYENQPAAKPPDFLRIYTYAFFAQALHDPSSAIHGTDAAFKCSCAKEQKLSRRRVMIPQARFMRVWHANVYSSPVSSSSLSKRTA